VGAVFEEAGWRLPCGPEPRWANRLTGFIGVKETMLVNKSKQIKLMIPPPIKIGMFLMNPQAVKKRLQWDSLSPPPPSGGGGEGFAGLMKNPPTDRPTDTARRGVESRRGRGVEVAEVAEGPEGPRGPEGRGEAVGGRARVRRHEGRRQGGGGKG